MREVYDIQHLIYLFQANGSWYGPAPILRRPPSVCEGTRNDIVDGLQRYRALQSVAALKPLWSDAMTWVRDDQPFRTVRLLAQQGHYARAFKRMPPECRSDPCEIGSFAGLPMSEAEQIFAARPMPPRRSPYPDAKPRESQSILREVHALLQRYDKRVVATFEVEKLRELLDRSIRSPWKRTPGYEYISMHVSPEVFEALDGIKGSRAARMRWAILESWALGPLPARQEWRNRHRTRICTIYTDEPMRTRIMREAKEFGVVAGAVIEEHCQRVLL